MARSAVSLTLLAVALALALSLASFAEARGGKNGIPDSVVGVDSRMGSKKTSSSSLTDDPNPACDVCRWAWTNAQAALADPETQAQVMRFAEETACGVLPSQEAQKCKEMAREYIPNAIAALESFDADEACGAVGFCPPQKDNAGEEKEEERETRRVIREALVSSVLPRATSSAFLTSTLSPRLGGPACPACRLALNSVKLQLEDPANQEQLLDKAHQVSCFQVFFPKRKNFFFSSFSAHLEEKKTWKKKKGLLHAPCRLRRALRLGRRRQCRQALRHRGRL